MAFQQVPPVYHHRIGDIEVTALSDGTLALLTLWALLREPAASRMGNGQWEMGKRSE